MSLYAKIQPNCPHLQSLPFPGLWIPLSAVWAPFLFFSWVQEVGLEKLEFALAVVNHSPPPLWKQGPSPSIRPAPISYPISSGVFGHKFKPAQANLPKQLIIGGGGIPHPPAAHMKEACTAHITPMEDTSLNSI